MITNYSHGELRVFDETLNKMLDSKRAEIFGSIVTQINYDKEHPEQISDVMSSEVESVHSDREEEVVSVVDTGPIKPIVKASGVVFHLHIDPDASSEDEPLFTQQRRGAAKQGSDKKNHLDQVDRNSKESIKSPGLKKA